MQHDLKLRVLRLDTLAVLPAYQSDAAAGMDLAACLPRGEFDSEAVTLAPRRILRIPCGIAVAIPPGFEGQVRPRSGLATKHGVTIPNAPGTVDADYRGEMFVALINLGPEPYVVRHGARIAQLVIAPVARAAVVEVPTLDETARGSGGFGSTGGH
ncbi:MAG: dUTP diphosphatase [Phycisphaeraceae bacterium]|nr:dUTP diphosphatase [Phycisphaeraceae bacterium]